MTIRRDQIKAVDVPQELVNVQEIGGEVAVRGMDLSAYMAFESARKRLLTPRDDETQEQANQRGGGVLIPQVLAATVIADDGLPVYTQAEWASFAAKHSEVSMRLWDIALKLSGLDVDAEKKA